MTTPFMTVAPGPRNARTDDSGLRFYSWQGVEYPSVTTVRALAGAPQPLVQWQITQVINRAIDENKTFAEMLRTSDPKVVATWLRKAATAERDKSARLGTAVHDAAASGLSMAQVGADVAPFLRQYLAWLSDSDANVLAVEKQVFNMTVGYAGTFDMLARLPDGRVWLIDLKTGKGTYPEHALQIEAYARGEFIGEDDQIDQPATDLLHQVSRRAILHLRPEGWSFKVVPPSANAWVAFRGLLAFARWAHENRDIADLVSAEKSGVG